MPPYMYLKSNINDVIQKIKLMSEMGLYRGATRTFHGAIARIKERMSVEGKARNANERVNWDTEKQRRAYFATDGFGKGIPYTRTQSYIQAWKISDRADGAVILENHHPAGAIGGTPDGWQSKIHRGRWPNLLVVLQETLPDIIPDFIKNLRVETGK